MISFKEWHDRAVIAEEMSPSDLTIPEPDLEIPRSEMPQIKTALMPEFLEYLRNNGVKVKKEKVPVKSIRSIQSDINREKVIFMMKQTDLETDSPPVITKDHHILDGSHRWLAVLNLSIQKGEKDHHILVWRADTDMQNLLKLAKKWPKINYKEIDESVSVQKAAQRRAYLSFFADRV